MTRGFICLIVFSWLVNSLPADESTVEQLILQLQDEDPDRGADAAEALGNLGVAAEPALPQLVQALSDKRKTKRTRDSDPGGFLVAIPVSSFAREALVKIGRPAAAHLGKELILQKESTSQQVLYTLLALEQNARDAIPALLRVIDTPARDEDRVVAIWAYCGAAPLTSDGLKPLILWMDDKDGQVRSYAVQSISRWKSNGAEAVPTLIRLLSDESMVSVAISSHASRPIPLREQVCRTLAEIGPAAIEALPKLKELMKSDKYGQVRVNAALAVTQIDLQHDEGIRELILILHTNSTDDSKRSAIYALGEIGPRAKIAWETLETTCRDASDPYSRDAAFWAITRIDGDNALNLLIEALREDPDASVRLQVVISLGELGAKAKPAIPVLIQELENKNNRSHEYNTPLWISEVLGKLGPSARDALPALESLANQDDESVKAAANKAILSIRGTSPDQK